MKTNNYVINNSINLDVTIDSIWWRIMPKSLKTDYYYYLSKIFISWPQKSLVCGIFQFVQWINVDN